MVLEVDGRAVRLTNLRKVFWPALGRTKGDRLQGAARLRADRARADSTPVTWEELERGVAIEDFRLGRGEAAAYLGGVML